METHLLIENGDNKLGWWNLFLFQTHAHNPILKSSMLSFISWGQWLNSSFDDLIMEYTSIWWLKGWNFGRWDVDEVRLLTKFQVWERETWVRIPFLFDLLQDLPFENGNEGEWRISSLLFFFHHDLPIRNEGKFWFFFLSYKYISLPNPKTPLCPSFY